MKHLTKAKSVMAVGLSIVGTAASAAVPATITGPLTDSAVDVAIVAGLVLLIYVAIKTFKYFRAAM